MFNEDRKTRILHTFALHCCMGRQIGICPYVEPHIQNAKGKAVSVGAIENGTNRQ